MAAEPGQERATALDTPEALPASGPGAGGAGQSRAAGTGSRHRQRWWSLAHNVWPVLVVAVAWQAFALSGIVPRVLTPTIQEIVLAIVRLDNQGTLWLHVGSTLARMLGGFVIAALAGTTLGMSMAY